jgi:hypothetical protein
MSCSADGLNCGGVKTEIQETNDVLTPYWHTIFELNSGKPLYFNYTQYTLFALQSKIIPELKPGYRIKFLNLQVDDKMVVIVQLYKGDEFVPSLGEVEIELRSLVDQALIFEPEYALLIHNRYPIDYKHECMSTSWLTSILPMLPVPRYMSYSDYPDAKINYDVFEYNGALYVRFEDDGNYELAYQESNNLDVAKFVATKGKLDHDMLNEIIADADITDIISIPLVKYLISLGADNYQGLMLAAASSNRLDIIKEYQDMPGVDFDEIINMAVETGNLEVVKKYLDKSGINIDKAFRINRKNRNKLEIYKFLASKGKIKQATLNETLAKLIRQNKKGKDNDTIEFLKSLGATVEEDSSESD